MVVFPAPLGPISPWIRPASTLTVDRYDDDWTRLAWVQVLGETRILDLTGHEDALDALAARYPQYRERAPRGPLLCLDPDRIVYWRATAVG